MQAIQIARPHGRRHRRRGDRADAGLAEHRRRDRRRRRDAGRGADALRQCTAGRSTSTGSSPPSAARTRAIFVNSPSNPTGWTATPRRARRDPRLRPRSAASGSSPTRSITASTTPAPRSPSFYDVAEDDDRILFVNTFSKNWAMTGWRIGWLSAPPALGQMIENLIQYSTSGVAAFMQRARDRRARRGRGLRRACRSSAPARGRDIVCDGLAATGRVRFAEPAGAFYLFFAVDGEPDTRAARAAASSTRPMSASRRATPSAKPARGFMRLCFARERRADGRGDRGGWSTWLGRR